MRNLIVCCDGTWNTANQEYNGVPSPTNVARLYNAAAEQCENGIEQKKYYHPGVGVERKWFKKIVGGIVGAGLGKNIKSAYKWLGVTYKPGDMIFLFGFSRGAYTVRCLAGMISQCGLFALSNLSNNECWKRVNIAYKKGYKGSIKQTGRKAWAGDWEFHHTEKGDEVGIFFLGVWDTVGALGIPNDLAILNLFDRGKYRFHDARLSDRVMHARHAVAIDELRASFAPTLWRDDKRKPLTIIGGEQTVKQIWFPGAHSDVGGGYSEKGLSDGALQWMMDEALAAGLAFRKNMYDQVKPDYQDALHNSLTGLFKHLKTQPRNIPLISPTSNNEVHRSVLDRQLNPPITQNSYRQTLTLKVGNRVMLPIYAIEHWNITSIYLEAGVLYQFTAKGQWLDGNIKSGPEGTKYYVFLLWSFFGKLKILFRKITKNKEADFIGTKREENLPWLSLVGVVANGGNPGIDGTPSRHEIFAIKDGCKYTPKKSGYLYCFANDAWCSYDNNRGSVMLTIQRL